ncbi:VWA domain-containing protein [Agromyces sp. NPDC056965]|uniref:VWA domain-containing protein n=1 Tax=Agromyces sp. NPDC056965 TaxID=3345983 RepID=UPI0036404CF1
MHRRLRTRSAARSDESAPPPPSPIRALLAAVTVGALILFGGPTLAAADELATPPAASDEATQAEEPAATEAPVPPAEEAPPAEAVEPPAEEAAPPAEEPAPPAEEVEPPAEEAAPPAEEAVPPAGDAAEQQIAAPAPVDCMAIPIGNDDRSARDACLAEQQAGLRSLMSTSGDDPYDPSDPNPDLPDVCGLDFALILDKSGSIGDTGMENLKDAADAFTDALKDTGSQVSVTSFDQDAALLQSAIDLTSANLGAIQGSYSGLASDGWTNWKRGLEVGLGSFGGFSDSPVELTIVITDGNPNTVDPANGGEFSDGSPEAVNPAIAQANSIKGDPSHVFVVAVGPNVSLGPIEAISGGTEFDGSNISTADYMTTDDYASLADDLQLVAKALCGGNVIIHKQVGAAFPGVAGGAGWEYSTATSNVDPTSDATDATSQTDPYEVTGFAAGPNPPARDVVFTETASGGSMLMGARCGTSADFGGAVDVPFDTNARTFTATVAKESTTHCWVLNTLAPVDLGIVKDYELPEGVEAIDNTDPEASEFWFTLTVTNHGPDVPGAMVTDLLPDTLEVISGITITPPGLWTAGFVGNQFTAEHSGVYAAGSVTEFRFQVRFLGEPIGPLPENPEVPPEPVPAEPVVNEACVSIVEPVGVALTTTDQPSSPISDENPGNDCDDTTVPTKAMQANAYVQCINDVPWLYHNVMTAGPVTPSDITVTWTPDPAFYPDAVPIVQTIPWAERNGRLLWPYGEVNAEGISIGWPGWRLAEPGDVVGQGTIVDSWENMVKDSSLPSYAFADQLHPMTITFEINPSQSVLAVYPQATPACAVTREAGPLIEKTSSVTSVMPGGTFDYTLSITNPGLGATRAMELFDEIPGHLKVNSITTPPAPAFPRWDDCEVTGKDAGGYGGTLHCVLNGQIGGTRPDAPDVVLSVTLSPTSTWSSIVNTGEICWNDLPDDQTAPAAEGAFLLDPAEPILCDDSTVTVHVPQPGAAIASTGFAGAPFVWIAAGMLLVGGVAVAFVVIRRRRTGGV